MSLFLYYRGRSSNPPHYVNRFTNVRYSFYYVEVKYEQALTEGNNSRLTVLWPLNYFKKYTNFRSLPHSEALPVPFKILGTNRLMLLVEIIAAYSESREKLLNTVCGQNARAVVLKQLLRTVSDVLYNL